MTREQCARARRQCARARELADLVAATIEAEVRRESERRSRATQRAIGPAAPRA